MTSLAIILRRIATYVLGGRVTPSQPIPFERQRDTAFERVEISAGATATFAWTVGD